MLSQAHGMAATDLAASLQQPPLSLSLESLFPWSQWEPNPSTLGSKVWLCRPTSTARLRSLSLYLVIVLLRFGSDTAVKS